MHIQLGLYFQVEVKLSCVVSEEKSKRNILKKGNTQKINETLIYDRTQNKSNVKSMKNASKNFQSIKNRPIFPSINKYKKTRRHLALVFSFI